MTPRQRLQAETIELLAAGGLTLDLSDGYKPRVETLRALQVWHDARAEGRSMPLPGQLHLMLDGETVCRRLRNGFSWLAVADGTRKPLRKMGRMVRACYFLDTGFYHLEMMSGCRTTVDAWPGLAVAASPSHLLPETAPGLRINCMY